MKGNEEKNKQHLRLTAAELNRYRYRKRLFTILLSSFAILFGTIYAIATVYMVTGSFTVNVNKYEMVTLGLSLSEHADLSKPTSVLNARIDQAITNIAEEDLPDNVNEIDGVHNGRNHIAYTFYLFNSGTTDEVNYEWQVKMSNVFNGIDEAIRLKLYITHLNTTDTNKVNSVTTYAKTASNGSGPERGTTPFYSTDIMARGRVDDFHVGCVTKFTAVLWLEGNDPDCVDWIKGGKMKIEMNMSIIH